MHDLFSLLFPFDKEVQEDIDQHDKQEQDKADGKQGIALQGAHRCIGHFRSDGCCEKTDGRKQIWHVGHIAGYQNDSHGFAR